MVCLDGVYLSYVAESISIPDQEKVDEYLPAYAPTFMTGKLAGNRYKLFDNEAPLTGGYRIVDWMESRYILHKLQNKCLDAVLKANEEFKALFGRSYLPVEHYKAEDAELIVVSAGRSR
jgi:pyruvate ferredoxin oxidoreductase alpha subunit